MSKATPLHLYRHILRAHRQLPGGLRYLGDSYVREEFQRHKKSDAAFVDKFMDQWTEYLHTIQAQTAASDPKAGLANSLKYDSLGKRLDPSLLNELNDQQLGQLYVLREEAKRVGSLKEIKTPGEI